jgi:hypothetical protein
MAINFLNIEAFDGGRLVVSFPADNNGQRINCNISLEALQDNFEGNNIDPIICFKSNRNRIEQKAIELIKLRRFELDGSILIRSADGG